MARKNTTRNTTETTMVTYVCPQCPNTVGVAAYLAPREVTCYQSNLHTPRSGVKMTVSPKVKAAAGKALSIARS